jgi:hypothetical protein
MRGNRPGRLRMPWYEWVPYGRVTWPVLVGAWKLIRGRKVTPQEKLALRSKWKPLFQEYIADNRRRNLRLDAIIRDMKRIDNYPEVSEYSSKGISPWFRVGLIDTYEKGFMAGLRWDALVTDAETGELRYPDRDKGEKGDRKVMVTGFIPYENVEDVDWGGDSYYDYPHIYCYFDYKGEPYKRIAFCEQRQLDEHVYFTDVADYKSVMKRSRKRWWQGLTGNT